MYLGLTGAVLGTIPTALLYFATYEYCKERLAARGRGQARPGCGAALHHVLRALPCSVPECAGVLQSDGCLRWFALLANSACRYVSEGV